MAKTSRKTRARVISSKRVLRGKGFDVFFEELVEPGAARVKRHIVRHPGSIVILALDEDSPSVQVLLERQYRHAAAMKMWELPAGSLEPGERKLAAAKRELQEETGYTARRWTKALYFFVSPGFLSESMTVYLARGLQKGIAKPEKDERITTRFFTLPQVLRMVMNRKIIDAKTIAAILWLAQRRSFS